MRFCQTLGNSPGTYLVVFFHSETCKLMPTISNETEFHHGPSNIKKFPLQYFLPPVILPDSFFPSFLIPYTE